MLVLGLAAVATGRVPLLMWVGAITAMTAAASAWTRFAGRGVTVEAELTPAKVFVAEPVTLRLTLTNVKRLPLPLVRVTVWLPPGLSAAPGSSSPTIRGFERRVRLPARSRVVLELPVRVRRRGEYWLEQVKLELTDPFDLAPVRRTLTPEAVVMVLPNPRVPIPTDIRKRLPFGAPAQAARIFESRERFAGVRPYEAGDPLNRIHWKLTGHAGKLQTKVFEPTRSAALLLALDLSGGEPFWDNVYPDLAEETIAWAAFLAREAVDAGWRVGLTVNAHLTRGRGPIRVPMSWARGNEAALFTALARMPNEPTSDLAPVLREAGRHVGSDTTAVVISPRPGRWLWQEMEDLRRRGTDVVHLSSLEALAWR